MGMVQRPTQAVESGLLHHKIISVVPHLPSRPRRMRISFYAAPSSATFAPFRKRDHRRPRGRYERNDKTRTGGPPTFAPAYPDFLLRSPGQNRVCGFSKAMASFEAKDESGSELQSVLRSCGCVG
jgi:hypothetical protein